jgi:hypothetical protein
MNWKLIVVGGLVYYIVTFIVSMATGPLIHEGVLDPVYRANEAFWRPELNQDPPDMAALMPRWIVSGLVSAFFIAGIYGAVRPAFSGPGWRKGLVYGFIVGLLMAMFCLGWSGVFGLPDKIWIWWALEGFLYMLPGGAALGWIGQKLAPE